MGCCCNHSYGNHGLPLSEREPEASKAELGCYACPCPQAHNGHLANAEEREADDLPFESGCPEEAWWLKRAANEAKGVR